MDKNGIHGQTRPQQLVVASTVGGRLKRQLQRLGHLQRCRWRRRGRAVQEIHDMGAADHLLIQCRCARLRHGFQPIHSDHGEDLDELAIPIAVFG